MYMRILSLCHTITYMTLRSRRRLVLVLFGQECHETCLPADSPRRLVRADRTAPEEPSRGGYLKESRLGMGWNIKIQKTQNYKA